MTNPDSIGKIDAAGQPTTSKIAKQVPDLLPYNSFHEIISSRSTP
jgi:hypothetical protein